MRDKERIRKYKKRYAAKHKEEIREYQKMYRQEHKEYIKEYKFKLKEHRKEYDKKYREKNKERLNKNVREWQLKNKDKLKEYKKTHREQVNFHTLRRKMRKNDNGGSHTLGERETLMAQYNWTCPCCGKSEPEIKLTEDHIIPVTKGGSNNIENIQPLCRTCNSRKHTKIIYFKRMMN